MMIALFIISCLFITLIVFSPWCISLMSAVKHKQDTYKGESILKVSIILPAYNEEECIEEKLSNLKERSEELMLDYEVLIGSDGSTDNTVKIANEFIARHRLANWKVFDFSNVGKCQTINRLVQQSTGECILSTDCDTILHPFALHALVDMFQSNRSLGCISSVPLYDLGEKSVQQRYWSIDLLIREKESENGDLIVFNGWLYGFRKQAFETIPTGVMADDLWIPISILLGGWQSMQCQESIVSCHRTDEETELHKRCRVMAGGMDVVFRLFKRLLLSPVLLGTVFLHKINRWLVSIWVPLGIISFFFAFVPFYIVVCLTLILIFFFLSIARLRNVIITIIQPILAFFKVISSKDLGRWDHAGRK
ncbi:glycosyltransferase [uncultured Desulfobacter sp.]|uniref:glycosyltransferase n=1 Tax=uncultured Desulfobacter sp. TaxID=240139 RepID=UPI0029F4A951|nr:glycosyltransferase [uncultured Desulfobacter sp.]